MSKVESLSAHSTATSDFDKALLRQPVKSAKDGLTFNVLPMQNLRVGNYNRLSWQEVQPQTGQVAFASSAEWVLPKTKTMLNRLFLRMTLTNDDTNTASVLQSTPALIDIVEVFVGSSSISRTYGDEMALKLRLMQTDEEFKSQCDRFGNYLTKTRTTGNHDRISTTSDMCSTTDTNELSRTYAIPLVNIGLDDLKPLLDSVNGDIRVKITLKAEALCYGDTNVTITISDSALEIEGYELNNTTYNAIKAQYSKPIHGRSVLVQRNMYSTLTAGTEATVTLTGIVGTIGFILLALKDTNAPTTFLNYEKWVNQNLNVSFTSFSLEDEAGAVLSAKRSLTEKENAFIAQSYFPSGYMQWNIDQSSDGYDLYKCGLYSASSNISASCKFGLENGVMKCEGRHRIKVNPLTSSAIPYVYVGKHVIYRIENGEVTREE
jgi:hypothetical protein